MHTIDEPKKVVVVSGDLTIDWNIARLQRNESVSHSWTAEAGTRACRQRGGAALLGNLIEELAEQVQDNRASKYEIRKFADADLLVNPADRRCHHSYALWKQFPYDIKGSKEQLAWRVSEFAGLDRSDGGWVELAKRSLTDIVKAEIIVFDDADLGFRDHPELWSHLKRDTARKSPWIVVKMSRPVAQGQLWEFLQQHWADRLIVVMNIDDLRGTEVQISRGLSWERTVQDLAWELVYNPCINSLAQCAHIVVSIGTAGAALLTNRQVRIFFDGQTMEGMWSSTYPGGMVGYKTCMTASIVYQLMTSPASPNLSAAIQSGIAAMRRLHLEGYGDRTTGSSDVQLAFPLAAVAAEIGKSVEEFASVKVPDPAHFMIRSQDAGNSSPNQYWTILDDVNRGALSSIARNIVLKGIGDTLKNVPIARFGNLTTIDRREIENYHSIRVLMTEYCGKDRQKRPLSIAVFGAPGSGKSFGVTEMAKSIFPGLIKKLEFNLSQFDDVEALHNAFHQVRDEALLGYIPLVFFDEFDTTFQGQPLGWLRYFLAPMQDGAFQQGPTTHPIGQAIFVFAGGTSESFESFGKTLASHDVFREVKGPDFISRLKGCIQVMGPNPTGMDGSSDPYFVTRRAILLRSMFERLTPQIIASKSGRRTVNIDPGVLNAFLHVREYKHGARSMEAIIDMSQLVGKTQFERSCLPGEAQLNLHVNGMEFLSLVQAIMLTPEILEKLAEAAHEAYCESKRLDGFIFGEEKSEEKKTNPLLIPYNQLPEWAKESNRVNVQSIPQKLAAIGLVMMPARGDQSVYKFSMNEVETMARQEHALWMEAKLITGFTRGKPSKDNSEQNEFLVEWEELPENIKQIDRDLVAGIPEILARAGYSVQRLGI